MSIPINPPIIKNEKQSPATISSFSNSYNTRATLTFAKQPKYRFWLKSFTLPGFTTSVETIDYPVTPAKVPGTDFLFNDMSAEFYLDEDFIVHGILYNTIFGGTPGKNFVCPRTNATIYVLDNSQSNIVAAFNFFDAQAIGQNDFQYEAQGNIVLTTQIQFSYVYYKPEYYKLPK